MASVQYLFSLTDTFPKELESQQQVLDVLVKFCAVTATVIQTAWRGYYWRKKYLTIRNATIIIQAFCRGWKTRKQKQKYIEDHAQDIKNVAARKAAIIIQAAWRGYITRKYLRNRLPKKLLAERKRLQEINERMQAEIREIFAKNMEKSGDEDIKKTVLFTLFKCHHLLRTHQSEGIYSDHGTYELSTIEKLMKALPLKDYMEQLRKCLKTEDKEVPYFFEKRQFRHYEDMLRMRDTSHDVKELPIQIDKNIHTLPFDMTPPKEKPYESTLIRTEPYPVLDPFLQAPKSNIKNIASKDFILSPQIANQDNTITKSIYFWNKYQCDIHNPKNII